MKIVINEDGNLGETEIIINCRHADEQVLKILAALRLFEQKLAGLKDGKTHIVEAAEALYCDTVDKKSFIYTENAVYETPLRLHELEERLSGGDFFRASKSSIINIGKIAAIMPDLGGRLEITLVNGERLTVSRQYARLLKAKLGLK